MTVVAFATVGVGWWVMAKERGDENRVYAATLLAMLLLTPPAGYYHENLVLLAVALCWRHLTKSDRSSYLTLFALALTAIPVQYGLSAESTGWAQLFYHWTHHGWGLVFLVPQLYGLILLFVLVTHGARKQ